MLRCLQTKHPSRIPSFLQGEDGRPGPEGDRGPAVSTLLPQLHPDPGPFLAIPLFSPTGRAWEPRRAWGQGKGLCGMRSWGENDAPPGIGVPREVLPAPCWASLQHLTFLTGRPWGPRTQRRQGKSLGQGAMGRQAGALVPLLTPTSLSALGVQGDTLVVEGPPGVRGSKGEPVRAVPILPLPVFPVPLGRAGGAFSEGPSLAEHIVLSPSATLQTPTFCPHRSLSSQP